jgi:uridine phosphorylase
VDGFDSLGAVRRDGVTDMLVPPSFPAVSDVRIVSQLEKTVQESGIPYEIGLCVSEGVSDFYRSSFLSSIFPIFIVIDDAHFPFYN